MRRLPAGATVLGAAVAAVGGSVGAAFAAACCVGPSVLAVIGVGGAVAAARLEPYRPYILLGSAGLIALGFWLSYRKAPEGAACPTRIGRFARGSLWVAVAFWVAAAAIGG